MLDALFNIARKAKSLDGDKLTKKALDDRSLQDEIARMNTIDQLYELGIDAKGNKLGNYSPSTIEGTSQYAGKKEKGQRYDHITLNDTGEFYKSVKVRNEEKDFVITGDTQKPDKDLANEFGQDILGLTNENIGAIIPDIKSSIIEQVRENLRA